MTFKLVKGGGDRVGSVERKSDQWIIGPYGVDRLLGLGR